MAQQIKVNSSTGNIQIQISRGAIGPSTTANVANTALNLNAASTANVIIGGGVANYVLSTDGAGNTSWVAQTGGGATNPAGSNTQVQFNDQGSFGAEPNFTYDKATDVLTADHFSGEGGNLSNIQGANVSGEVSFAATANAVALANVAGAGNIASVNLDGNVANVLRGDGTFSPDTAATPGGSNTQVQYNDNGSFAGEANFTYDSATGNLTAPNIIASTQFTGDINGAILVEVYNASGGTLNKGDIVALNGAAHGSTPDVVKADSGNASLMPGFAVVKEGISSTAVGEAVISGKMNFSSHGFTIGAQLYVDGTGTFTETRPSGENQLVQKIATVTNSNTLNIAGAGRTNDIPNLNEGNIFLGNASNVGATTNLNSAINTHLAAFGSNTITTTGNVDVGNLFIGNATANVEIASQGDISFNGSNSVQTLEQYTADYSGGPGAYKFNNEKVYVVNGYGTNPGTDTEATLASIKYLANDGANLAQGFQEVIYTFDPLSSDPLVPAVFEQSVPSYLTDLANVDTQTTTRFTINSGVPGCFFSTNTEIPDDGFGNAGPTWRQKQYSGTAIRFERRNGNADARTQVVAGDQIGRIEWAPESLTGGGGGPQLRSRPGFITGKVSSAFTGANGERVGQGLEFGVVNDDGLTVVTHDFYPNGAVSFTGNVETGNLTANPSLLVQGTGANTTTIAPDLTSIGSAQFTQVSTIEEKTVDTAGSFIIGKLYTIETTGTTDFTQVGAGSQVLAPNIQQFNTYTIISQGTSDFTLIGAPDNNVGTTFTANANGTPGTGVVGEFEPGTQFTATGVGSGTGTASYKNPFLIGYMTEDYDGEGRLDNAVYARTTSGNIAKGASFGFISYDTVGNANTDPLVASQVQFTANPTAADLATQGTGTVTTMTMGGPGADGFLTVIGAGASPNVYLGGAWKQFQYRDISMDFIRRNGNADTRTSTVADDETSLNFYNTQDLGGGSVTGSTYNYPARMGSKVDPGWVDPQNGALGIENGLFFEVVNDFFDRTQHRMYSNGTVEFNQSSIDYLGNPVSTNPVTIGTNGIITADGGNISNIAVANVNGLGNIATVNLDGNTANYLDGTGSWAPVTASPGGFFDTIQFNNGGTLDGNSSFQFIPGSNPEVQLNGTASSSDVGILRLQNSILDLYTEDMSGGYTPMSFSTYNSGGFIDPINYYRARGTRSTPAAVIAGDTVKNQRNQVYSGPTATLAFAGGETTTVQANDGTGNIAVTTTISTARPANGPTSLDKILLDTEFVQTAGNIQMNNTDARFTAGRIAQVVHIFANLPASPVQGERAMISDGPSYSTFGTVVAAGGGSNYMPLFWDGSNWRMG